MLNDKAEKNQLFWGKATLKIYFNAKFSLKKESKTLDILRVRKFHKNFVILC